MTTYKVCDVVLGLPLHLTKSVEKKRSQVFCTEKTLMSAAREVGLIGLLLLASAIWDLLIMESSGNAHSQYRVEYRACGRR